jgi:hypothetical protein
MSLRWTEDQLLEYQLKTRRKKVQSSSNSPPVVDDQPERALQDRLEAYCRENGLYAFHDRSRRKNAPGHPDLVIACPGGRVLWLELKSRTGRLTADQKRVRLQLLCCGHEFHLIRSYRQFLDLVEEKGSGS